MPKLTKTQVRRLYRDILGKAQKLWATKWGSLPGVYAGAELMSTKDYMAIEAIIRKYQKKIG